MKKNQKRAISYNISSEKKFIIRYVLMCKLDLEEEFEEYRKNHKGTIAQQLANFMRSKKLNLIF